MSIYICKAVLVSFANYINRRLEFDYELLTRAQSDRRL